MDTSTNQPLIAPDIAKLPDDALLTRRQLSNLSGFALQTLKGWPALNKGPKVTIVEGRPRYRVAEVRRWLGAQDA